MDALDLDLRDLPEQALAALHAAVLAERQRRLDEPAELADPEAGDDGASREAGVQRSGGGAVQCSGVLRAGVPLHTQAGVSGRETPLVQQTNKP